MLYTSGNDHGDRMFKAAAETRKKNIEEGKGFDPKKDIVLMLEVTDLGKLKDMIEGAIDENSEKYGETQEVGMWSHAGLDGPIGTEETSENQLGGVSTQMTLQGWGNIDFNWKNNGNGTNLSFYGCNTGNSEYRGDSFATNISGLDNYKNVNVSGQTTSAYPSLFTNKRVTTIARNGNLWGAWTLGGDTYMVGGNKGQGYQSTSPSIKENYPSANPMQVSKNGAITKTIYQPGTKF
ncbi:hypothetical protein [Flavobacterium sp.]|uniref:hypothetical protein n=1 Tax=Flavobacterium sp. TaxID=239 RepID=UPI0025C5FA5F|nr:hypothetical protein [Flavobacterium sp.]